MLMCWIYLPKPQGSQSQPHPLKTVKAVLKLEEVLLSATRPTADDLDKSLEQQHLTGPLLHDQKKVHTVSKSQLCQDMLGVPMDFWSMNFWTCRDQSHSKFSCAYFYWKQWLLIA